MAELVLAWLGTLVFLSGLGEPPDWLRCWCSSLVWNRSVAHGGAFISNFFSLVADFGLEWVSLFGDRLLNLSSVRCCLCTGDLFLVRPGGERLSLLDGRLLDLGRGDLRLSLGDRSRCLTEWEGSGDLYRAGLSGLLRSTRLSDVEGALLLVMLTDAVGFFVSCWATLLSLASFVASNCPLGHGEIVM